MINKFETMIDKTNFLDLPEIWSMIDTIKFSEKKSLYNYQTNAIINAIKGLYLYYSNGNGLENNEINTINRNSKLLEEYYKHGLDPGTFDISKSTKNDYLFDIYDESFTIENNVLSEKNFFNRMSFWMATGSGKSLVLIKLITILNTLIENNEIPNRDILILVPRDDLMEQLILLIDEYNKTIDNSFIELHSLKDLDEVKYSNSFNLDTIQVFYYRSDNISDVEKEKQINFKNYDNNGEWYILLDEAHKGGKEGSKRQAYFTSLARNGFLFNFSATFTDELDKATTVYNFNLEKFIMDGYGKNIYLSNSEYTSFIKSKKEVDFTNFEKEKIVAKSLIMLTATKLSRESIKDLNLDMFHSPLLLTLVDSVNKNDSDLLLFFKEIEKFANNTIEINVIRDAKKELIHELKNKNKFLFGEKSIDLNVDIIESITNESILKKVFNVDTPGAIEVMQSPDNKELAFRIKSSDISSPFALIKIGDVTPWIKTKLVDYDFIETFSDKNYFKTLDSNENINILMGSRSFYEGWDSSRPNIINFINIGKSTDSKKFLLQSIGRGVRVQPLKDKRKRIKFLYEDGQIDRDLYTKVKSHSILLESLFLFTTNKNAAQKVISDLESEKVEQKQEISLIKKDNIHDILIPKYKKVQPNFNNISKINLSRNTFSRLKSYLSGVTDAHLVLLYDFTPNEIKLLRNSFEKNNNKLFSINSDNEYADLDFILKKIKHHVKNKIQLVDTISPISDEIIHFSKIKVEEEYREILKEKLESIFQYVEAEDIDDDNLIEKLQNNEITKEEFKEQQAKLHAGKKEVKHKDLVIKYIPEHYFIPLIISKKEKVEYISNIIHYKSEVDFIDKLEKFIDDNEGDIKDKYEWWMFSKIDEVLDNVYIPYFYDNQYRKFFPDFIFWLKEKNSNNYTILFVDPKGMGHVSWTYKVDDFKELYENKTFKYQNNNINVKLLMFTTNNQPPKEYKEYWTDTIESIFELNI